MLDLGVRAEGRQTSYLEFTVRFRVGGPFSEFFRLQTFRPVGYVIGVGFAAFAVF